jgi:hypothetical protein
MTYAHNLGHRKLWVLGISATFILSSASNAWAAVLAYEGFDYAADTLLVNAGVGLGGGTGWADPWDESQAPSLASAIQAGSLQYTDALGNALQTTGGKLLNTGVDGTSQPGRTLAARRASPDSGNTVSTWISFLGQRIGERNADGGQFDGTYRRGANLAMFDLGGAASQPEKFNMGESSNQQFPLGGGLYEDRWQTRVPGIPAAVIVPQPYPQNPEGTGTSTATGAQLRDAFSEAKFTETGLFVMRVDHVAGDTNAAITDGTNGGNDNIYIWMNPNLNTTPLEANASIKYISTEIVAAANALATPVAPYQGSPTVPGSSSGGEINFDRLRLFAGNVSGTTPYAEWLFDELRVGETFADVAPHTPSMVGVPGDYNENDVVDAADYVVWRNGPATLPNEGASPGVVNQADYEFWRSRFGATSAAGAGLSGAVPEPATCILVAMACAGMLISRRGRA